MITNHYGDGATRFFSMPSTPSMDATATVGGSPAPITAQVPTGILLDSPPAVNAPIVITHTHVPILITYADLGYEAGGGGGGGTYSGMNPADKSASIVLSGDNLVVTEEAAGFGSPASVRSVIGFSPPVDAVSRVIEFVVSGRDSTYSVLFGLMSAAESLGGYYNGMESSLGVRLTGNANYSIETIASSAASTGELGVVGDIFTLVYGFAAKGGSVGRISMSVYKNGTLVSTGLFYDCPNAAVMHVVVGHQGVPANPDFAITVRMDPAEMTYPTAGGAAEGWEG
jgi:hypothetical protein